ncbi:GNAT family N-acetyltransferase [Pseudonocardia humida]|uniref:GNAT family N-acetyltransferase n=1 Tax=Pseudonocardia humida TaxID=2800819 RepID=A0ABT1A7F2_9PSEU|nr:GNAT family N-acetyltransferase [Pseudonocardia humida]MCO1658948.1 GNAT family N-acetyltransferase [Pseudonocardia humida]
MASTTIDSEAAARVLAAAFAEDPLARWLLPGGAAAAAEAVFRPVVRESAAHDELAASADGSAVAVWLPRAPGPAHGVGELPAELPPRLRTFLALIGQRHPRDREHLHLVFLGVAPDAQGRGLGGALLRRRLSRADAEGVPAYLEASSARSRQLYERHGFRDAGDPITLPDGPPLWPMWREPRP